MNHTSYLAILPSKLECTHPSEVGNEVPSITTPPVSKTCNGSKQQEGGDNMEQPSHPAELYRKKVEIPMI